MSDLEAIKARAEAATPGPWDVTCYSGGFSFNGPPRVYAGTDPQYGEPRAVPAAGNLEADAAFIAHARTDVPALLAMVDRLRDVVAVLEAENARLAQWAEAELEGRGETFYGPVRSDLTVAE